MHNRPKRDGISLMAVRRRKSKNCSLCGKEKPLDCFHKDRGTLDGHYNQCKKCRKGVSRKDYISRKEAIAISVKQWRKTPRGKEARKKEFENSRRFHPGKYRARYTLTNAVRDGKIVKTACKVCGNEKSEGHHPDYRKPLDVIWLCKNHHDAVHQERKHRRLTPIS